MFFSKIHGLGNDYIYIDATKYEINDPSNLSKILSDRNIGIGSDGIILLMKPTAEEADFKMRIFNSDGTEAEMCGNGIRGLAKYIYENNYSKKDKLKIETNCGIKELKLDIKDSEVKNVTVDMGEIKHEFKDKIIVDNQIFEFTSISVGNPHCVIFTDNIQNLDLKKIGSLIENNPIFPNRTNVEFIQIIDKDNILMRVWERGSGETLACGTGATASVIAGYLDNKLNNHCKVHLKEGILIIYFNENNNHAFLTGAVTKVFDGKIDVKELIKRLSKVK